MSLSINPIQTVKIIDPVLDFDAKTYFPVLQGGERTSWKPIISTSYSNSSASFSAPPPSPNVCVSRNVKLKQPVTITFQGNAPLGQSLLQSQYDSPRAYPLSSNMNTLQIDLNNTSFSINMSDTIQALLRYHNPDCLKDGNMSTTPSTLDKSQQYADLANSIHNPLASVIDCGLGGIDPRGAFPAQSMVNNVSLGIAEVTTAVATYDFVEDLFLSPMLFGTSKQENGFIGLQTFQVTVNWKNDLSRMWSHSNASGATLSSVTVQLGAPVLFFEYKTPSPLQSIPRFRQYPYYEIQRYPTELQSAIQPAQTTIFNSSNIQLNSIPRMLYVYCRKRNGDLSFLDSDTYLSIEGISVNWANNSGLLSNASKFDLYEMSKKNGCNLNWRDWSGEDSFFMSGSTLEKINGVGSVLAIEMGTDLSLRPEECPGMNGTYQLQLSVNVKNQSDADITPALYVVVSNEGIFTIENNSAYSQIGVVSKEDVLNAQSEPGMDYNDLGFMSGASIFKHFGRKLKRAYQSFRKHGIPAIQSGVDTARKLAPIAKEIYDIAKMFGVGLDEAQDMYEEYGSAILYDTERLAGKSIIGGASARGVRRRAIDLY